MVIFIKKTSLKPQLKFSWIKVVTEGFGNSSNMSRNQKRQLRDQFIDFTDTTSAIAEQFLKSTNYDLELAINEYLSYQASSSRKDNRKLAAIFDSYKDPDSDIIGIDGTIKYIEDLGYEPEDKVTLALADFLESPSAGVFNRKNFILKWQSTHAETIDDMKEHVKYLEQQLDSNIDYLKKIYEFTFKFSLEEGQRTLPLETAIEYWKLLLSPLYGDKVQKWITFLTQDWKQAVSKDTWNMFFIFLQDYEKDPELFEYDETAAWPSIIDDFVEFIKDGRAA